MRNFCPSERIRGAASRRVKPAAFDIRSIKRDMNGGALVEEGQNEASRAQ